jgi:3'5'-cyclic nucleotide phosphodiesterase
LVVYLPLQLTLIDTGVPNAQLIEERLPLASIYNNRSIAEQNSLDLSLELLQNDRFADFRKALMPTPEEYKHFRQLVVNVVMATDIVDKDLKALRNARWEKAFQPDTQEDCIRDQINRKATIVIEHLIQASDVSHTMQHWHIYRKWNQRFFAECYVAFLTGRAEKNPADYWYNGEIGFFDFYIVPLAKKLKECGVFGKSSGEYLDYAIRNRNEWEAKGRDVVAEMIESIHQDVRKDGNIISNLSSHSCLIFD